MENISFETGIKEYTINDKHLLRFNPNDPNVYARYIELYNDIDPIASEYDDITNKYTGKLDEKGFPVGSEELVNAIKKLDTFVKKKLSFVFDNSLDFDVVFEGVNIFAATDTGDTALGNLVNALLPAIETSAIERERLMQEKTNLAVQKSAINREQRRALGK